MIRTATVYTAVRLGVHGQWGSIAVGKTGDFVVVNGNPLEDIRRIRDDACVIPNGKVVFRKAGCPFNGSHPESYAHGRAGQMVEGEKLAPVLSGEKRVLPGFFCCVAKCSIMKYGMQCQLENRRKDGLQWERY